MSGILRTDNTEHAPRCLTLILFARGWRPPRLPNASAVDVWHFYLEDILVFELMHNQRMHKDIFMTVWRIITFVLATRTHDHTREGTRPRQYFRVLERMR
jgi:hypothetical protein